MKSVLAFSLILAAAAVGCNQPSADVANKSDIAPDNTKKNQRDREQATLTPGDQGENDADRGITQQIRQGVVKDDALSMTAKNIKIITIDGVVTLRGPVKSEQEKTEIANVAQHVSGIKRLDNQLEIASN